MLNIDAVLSKTSLLDLVTKAGANVDTRTGRCACPIHGGHDKTGFHVYREGGKEKWSCFSGECGSGDAIDFVKVWRGWDFRRAYEFLGGEQQADPVEMKRLADERVARAKKELEEKQAQHEAARRELQVAEMHLHYHDTMREWGRKMWIERGIDEGMQDFWTLGSCDDFVINDSHHTTTLTIPIFGENWELLNIKHRLVNPEKPGDKYRPERGGLGIFPPFLAVPSMGYDGGLIVVTEGEIKAMVTWLTLTNSDIQVIGVPGRTQFKNLSEKLKGKNVVVIPDPGAEKDAYNFAKSIHARFLPVVEKIDDFILQTGAKSNEVYAMIKQSRRT